MDDLDEKLILEQQRRKLYDQHLKSYRYPGQTDEWPTNSTELGGMPGR